MKYSKRLEIFEQVRVKYAGFLTSVLWRLTGDKELFAEAMQYALLGMWRNVEKLDGKKAGSYIYRIALSANSAAWRNRIGRDGEISRSRISTDEGVAEKVGNIELVGKVRRVIAQLPAEQSKAIVMRYLEQQDYKDVADKLGCSEAGVRSNVSKALAALKDKLANLTERE